MAEKMSSTDDSSEVAGELDDALNELGMLSAANQDKSRTRSDFIKDKWTAGARRGYPLRYPLRREKEREITWCSGSSSSSSTGSSSRRSSSTSSSGGSFSSAGSCYSRSYSRSSLISSYSIAETPTGINPPGPFGGGGSSTTTTSSSNSSLCSSIDLMDQPMSGVTMCNYKSIDFPKVLRRVHHQSYKPYNLGKPSRRFSLQLGIHREERPFNCESNNLNLRSGLSDSEASSGSGTGTPPPGHPHQPHQHPPSHLSFQGCTLILDPGFNLRLKSPFKETKSNPGSPTSEQQFRCDQQQFRADFSNNSNRIINQVPSHEQALSSNLVDLNPGGQGMSASSLGFRRCCEGGGGVGGGNIPTDLNVTCCYQPSSSTSGTSSLMIRSKSLDDLNYALLLQDNNSSCSSDAFACATGCGSGGGNTCQGIMTTSYDVQRQSQEYQQQHQVEQQLRTSFNLNTIDPDVVLSSNSGSSCFNQQLSIGQQRVCSSSSNLVQPCPSQGQQLPPNQLLQPNSGNSSQVPVTSSSCDNLFDSVVQRIGRLEM